MTYKNKKIINLTGPMGSGKGTIANYLKNKYNFTQLTFSTILKTEVVKRGLEVSIENIFKVHDELRTEYGDDVIARWIVQEALSKEWDRIVFEGGRYPAQAIYIKDKFPDALLLYINSNPSLRKQRLMDRKREIDPVDDVTLDALLAKDLQLSKLCKDVPGAIVVQNNSDFKSLEQEIDTLMHSKLSI